MVVPQPLWIEAPAHVAAEAPQPVARTASGPRIQDSPYYQVKNPDSGERDPLLGMEVEELSPQLATDLGITGVQGVVIRKVAPGSPAERAGLLAGDVIISVDVKPVRTVAELRQRVQAGFDPANVPIGLLRGGFQMSAILQAE